MAINSLTENLFPLAAATSQLPRRRQGKKAHTATVYRWAQRGLRGVRLETLRVGGTLCTSREALQRFFERLTDTDSPPPSVPSVSRKASIEKADAELARLGI